VVTADGVELEELELPESEELEPESELPVSEELEPELLVPVELDEGEVCVAVLDVMTLFADVLSAGSCPVASWAKITPHTPRKTPSAPPMIRRRSRRIRERRSASRR
jgi:hypothetical protein